MVAITNQGSLTWSNATEGIREGQIPVMHTNGGAADGLPLLRGSWRAQRTAGAGAGLGAAEGPPPLTRSWYSLSNSSCSACCSEVNGSITRIPHTSYGRQAGRQADSWAGRQELGEAELTAFPLLAAHLSAPTTQPTPPPPCTSHPCPFGRAGIWRPAGDPAPSPTPPVGHQGKLSTTAVGSSFLCRSTRSL